MPLSKAALSALTDTTIFENTSELISATNVNVLIKDIIDAMALESEIPASTSFTGGTVTGATQFTNGLVANTFSATTYQNLPLDIFVSGGTYSAGTATFKNTSGGTFTITGFSTGGSLMGTPTEIIYFDASGNTSSDSGFTRTATGFNAETDFSATTLSIYQGDNLLGFGAQGSFVGAITPDGYNGLITGDLTSLGYPLNVTLVGYLNPTGDGGYTTYSYNTDMSRSHYQTEVYDGSGDVSINLDSVNGFSVTDENSGNKLFQVNPNGAAEFNSAYTFPTSDSSPGNVLTTDGSGNVTWQPVSGNTPVYPSLAIPFGDGSTAGGVTSGFLTFDNTGKVFNATDGQTGLKISANGYESLLTASNGTNGGSVSVSGGISGSVTLGITGLGFISINGAYNLPTISGASGTTLIADASGNLIWQSAVHNIPVSSAKTSVYDIVITDYVIPVDSTTGSTIINLPVTYNNGDTYIIKDVAGNASSNPITINATGAGITIDGSATATINTNYGFITLTFSTFGSGVWMII